MKSYPLLSRLAIYICLPGLITCLFVSFHIYNSIPDTEDTSLIGLRNNVQIAWNKYGVPSIKANTDEDAFFAMGYVHARDRLWQLEVQRRIASGRLSEIFGHSSLQQDVWLRTLGLYESSAKAWSQLSPAAQNSLRAYARGINAWLDKKPVLPLEFLMLGIEPEPWQALDSLAWTKVFAMNLAGNFRQELANMMIATVLNSDQLATFIATPPANTSPLAFELEKTSQPQLWNNASTYAWTQRALSYFDLANSMEKHLGIGGKYVGSNAWVVAPEHSEFDGALLANDPHLGLQVPSLWYGASITGDNLHVSGMTLVGLPVIIFGRNAHISWGGTSMMADVQDVFIEQINPLNTNQYWDGVQWREFARHKEEIHIREDFPTFLNEPYKPVSIEVRRTAKGPVISDIFGELNQVLSLKWSALEEHDTSYEAFFRLAYARNWQEFEDAMALQVAPALNMLYGDRHGNIGYLGIGKVPVRGYGSGELPLPGNDSAMQWQGYIPWSAMPRQFNPPAGLIVSANNQPTDESYPYFISHNFAPEARAQRIAQLLRQHAEQSALNATSMARIQHDTRDLAAAAFLPLLLSFEPDDTRQREALESLKDWRGEMTEDSRAATLFHAWVRHIRFELFADELTAHFNQEGYQAFLSNIVFRPDLQQLARVLSNNRGNWCDVVTTPESENCQHVLKAALDQALLEIEKLASFNRWRWGDVHNTLYAHIPFSQVKVLDSIFERRIANGGSVDSINVASAHYALSDGYVQDFGPGFRQIMAFNQNTVEHLYMNSTGQSGNLLSQHYDDMIQGFRDGELLPFDTSLDGKDIQVLLAMAKSAP